MRKADRALGIFDRPPFKVIANANSHPDDLRADSDGLFGNCGRLAGGAKDIHHVHIADYCLEVLGDPFAEQFFTHGARIDRDDTKAFALKIFHCEITRPVPVGAGADHSDCLHLVEYLPQKIISVVEFA